MPKHTKFILLLIFTTLHISSFAQHAEITERSFSVELQTYVFNRYFVLKDQPDIRDNYYREVSQNDVLLLEGLYENNVKVGKWVSYYNNNHNKVKETTEYFPEKKQAEQWFYFENGNLKEHGKLTTDFKGEPELKIGEWQTNNQKGVPVTIVRFNNQGQKDGSTDYFDEKGRLKKAEIFSAGKYMNTKSKYEFQEERITETNNRVLLKKSEYSSIYRKEVKPIQKEIKGYKKENKSEGKYYSGERILGKLVRIDNAFKRFDEDESNFEFLYKEVRDKYVTDYPQIFQNEIKVIKDTKFVSYRKSSDVSEKLLAGNDLINKLGDFKLNFNKFRKLDSKLSQLVNITNSYQEYPALYRGEIKQLLNKYAQYKVASTVQVKLDLSTELNEKFTRLEDLYPNLAFIDEQITTNLDDIYTKYKNNFMSIYRGEIGEFKKNVSIYQGATTVNDKANSGEKIIKTITALKDKYTVLIEAVTNSEQLLNEVVSLYKDMFPYVYSLEIKTLIAKSKETAKVGYAETMLTQTQGLIIEFEVLKDNFKALNQLTSGLNEKIATASETYKETFKFIYKGEIAALKEEKRSWDKLGKMSDKISKGKSLDRKLQDVNSIYKQLAEQNRQVEDLMATLTDLYKIDFPNIYTKEVLIIPIISYREQSTAKRKFKEGITVLEKAQRLDLLYKGHSEQRNMLTEGIERFQENYKTEFKTVYKYEYEKVDNLHKNYLAIGHSELKSEKANNLISKLLELNSIVTELHGHRNKIENKFVNFEDKFKKNKPNKVLYKKGKLLYKERFKEYDAEGDASQKIEKGDKLITILDTLLRKYSTNNARLNKRMKKMKTANEIERAIGIR